MYISLCEVSFTIVRFCQKIRLLLHFSNTPQYEISWKAFFYWWVELFPSREANRHSMHLLVGNMAEPLSKKGHFRHFNMCLFYVSS